MFGTACQREASHLGAQPMASDVHLTGGVYHNDPSHTCRARTSTSCTSSRRRSWSSCRPRTGASKQRPASCCVGVAAAALPLAVRLDRRRKGDSRFGNRCRRAGVRPSRQQAVTLPARWQTTAPSSVSRGIHGTLRRTSAAVRGRRGKETGADRDRIEGHKTIALTSMARAASRSRMGRSSGAAAEQQRSSYGQP